MLAKHSSNVQLFSSGDYNSVLIQLPIIIVQGLADESEFVRDTALQAGGTIINRYADTAVEIFLPQLERGLFDDSWRIR